MDTQTGYENSEVIRTNTQIMEPQPQIMSTHRLSGDTNKGGTFTSTHKQRP